MNELVIGIVQAGTVRGFSTPNPRILEHTPPSKTTIGKRYYTGLLIARWIRARPGLANSPLLLLFSLFLFSSLKRGDPVVLTSCWLSWPRF